MNLVFFWESLHCSEIQQKSCKYKTKVSLAVVVGGFTIAHRIELALFSLVRLILFVYRQTYSFSLCIRTYTLRCIHSYTHTFIHECGHLILSALQAQLHNHSFRWDQWIDTIPGNATKRKPKLTDPKLGHSDSGCSA